jgi:NTP pyrophosphatase (non-canonical NTP hydrolase)
MTINELITTARESALSKGFDELKAKPSESFMGITSEISEAFKAWNRARFTKPEILERLKKQWSPSDFQEFVKDTMEDEIADAVIWISNFCGAHSIDLETHIWLKLKYNSTRERQHGLVNAVGA